MPCIILEKTGLGNHVCHFQPIAREGRSRNEQPHRLEGYVASCEAIGQQISCYRPSIYLHTVVDLHSTSVQLQHNYILSKTKKSFIAHS